MLKLMTYQELRDEFESYTDKRRCLIISYFKNKVETKFFVVCPHKSHGGFYRQAVSIGAFNRREDARFVKSVKTTNKYPVEYCDIKYLNDMTFECNDIMDKELIELGRNIQHNEKYIMVTGLFDFYKLIGYDYKKQKYVGEYGVKSVTDNGILVRDITNERYMDKDGNPTTYTDYLNKEHRWIPLTVEQIEKNKNTIFSNLRTRQEVDWKFLDWMD